VTDSPQHDRSPAPTGTDEATGAPGDREFHLRRVCARFPRTLSARRLAMLAALLDDENQTPP